MQTMWQAWAFFKRDLLSDLSYKFSFFLQVLNIFLTLASFYFLSKLVGDGILRNYAPFPFLLIGMAVNGYMTTSLYCFAQGIRGNQQAGTLKAVFSTPISPLSFLLYSSLYPMVRAGMDAALYLLGGVLFGLSLANVHLVSMLVIFTLSVVAFGSIGILSATFTLVFKKGDPLLWLFGGLSWLLGGVFYPLEVLPPFLQQAAQLLPITHALDGMRAAVLRGASPAEILPQIEILALFSLASVPLSLLAFVKGVEWTRVSGSLSHL
ncbi:MAG: hypothetical protein A3H28_02195 [Acidobacteria bacterium RIFCSPLOWO2_02_FULL_61_28]|nr:MAG: hypothetical protein A3H28_02195 [Acidobacteria bacterium RIFCSPLOWO2_02_FULL_61_28]